MKKWRWFIVPVLLVPVAAIVYLSVLKYPLKEISSTDKPIVLMDTILPNLPADPAQAKKELQRVQKALAALKPKGLYIVIDTHSNQLYLRTTDSILIRATCSTGYGGELVDSATGKKWVFNTPKGVFKVNSKLVDPWWRKPDWAFIEEGEEIPKDPAERYDPNMLGEYALGFGNGYFIHGTLYTRLLGVAVSHGCVRLGNDDLEFIYKKVSIGTPVYVI
ncbi:MAG: L,D-transpeptidase [Calditrichaeota bacterium]|nr:L,D-transpeptidase [Calditrichota bacterium]